MVLHQLRRNLVTGCSLILTKIEFLGRIVSSVVKNADIIIEQGK